MISKTIHLQYFAVLREQRGLGSETIETSANTAQELYQEISARYHFTFPIEILKVAINDEFQQLGSELHSGDSVVFIPPVAGG
jgi:sulfur-carrier protein